MTRQREALTADQHAELLAYRDGKPRRVVSGRPNSNLIRRNLLTRAPSEGRGYYRITASGARLLELTSRRVMPAPRPFTSAADCIDRVSDAGRLDLLEHLLSWLREILADPATATVRVPEPSRRDPA